MNDVVTHDMINFTRGGGNLVDEEKSIERTIQVGQTPFPDRFLEVYSSIFPLVFKRVNYFLNEYGIICNTPPRDKTTLCRVDYFLQ